MGTDGSAQVSCRGLPSDLISTLTPGGVMLNHGRFEVNIPAADIDRAKAFYADKLGLSPSSEPVPGYLRYETSDGTSFNIYQTEYAGTAGHTIAQIHVADVEQEVGDLKAKGVTFEVYDMPGVEWRGGGGGVPEGGEGAGLKGREGDNLLIDPPAGARAAGGGASEAGGGGS